VSWVVSPSSLIDACGHVAPELGVSPKASETALRIAMREADHLADDVYDVPGAVLFALGRTPRCFSAFRSMSVLATQWQAKALGFKLEATPLQIASILGRVARGEMDYAAVRAWMADRLFPFGG
jgi:hypothetical protein